MSIELVDENLLIEACNLIDRMKIAEQNQDLRQGDTSAGSVRRLYEYMLGHLQFAGVVARVESLRGRMGESTRQVEGLFESLLKEVFKHHG